MADFGLALPRIRSKVTDDLDAPVGSQVLHQSIIAAIVRLLDTTLMRVGIIEHRHGVSLLSASVEIIPWFIAIPASAGIEWIFEKFPGWFRSPPARTYRRWRAGRKYRWHHGNPENAFQVGR